DPDRRRCPCGRDCQAVPGPVRGVEAMDATATLTLQIGASAPEFSDLRGVDGNRYSLSSFDDSRFLVVVFTSNGCPTVRAFEERLGKIAATYAGDAVRVVAINANNPYLSPDDS